MFRNNIFTLCHLLFYYVIIAYYFMFQLIKYLDEKIVFCNRNELEERVGKHGYRKKNIIDIFCVIINVT